MGEWKEVRLGDLVDAGILAISDGYRVRNEELGPEGIPFVRGGDIGDGWINTDTVDHIRPEFTSRVQAKIAVPNDLAFITKGTVGRAGRLRVGQRQVVFAPQVAYWRVLNRDALDPGFAFYLIRSRAFQAALDGVKTHGAMVADYVSISQQMDFRLLLPGILSQRAIARILGTLDDKIDLNRRVNDTLETMAQALFKSWFVDFDPVHAKTEGRNLDLPKPLGDLFPDSFEDSQLGDIPRGWRVRTVGDTVSLSRDTINPGDYPTEAFDHFSIPAFDAEKVPACDFGDSIKSQKYVVVDRSVLVSKLNPETPRVWMAPSASSRRQVASTEFLICVADKTKAMSRELIYCLTSSPPFVAYLTTHASGTSNSHQRVRPQDFLNYQWAQPQAPLCDAFTKAVSPLLGQSEAIRSQSATLSALRDALLPKLISGELPVKDAERFLSEAA